MFYSHSLRFTLMSLMTLLLRSRITKSITAAEIQCAVAKPVGPALTIIARNLGSERAIMPYVWYKDKNE
jgi:hypothetical protein